LGDKVCLFEKENRLGGRIYDVSRSPGGTVFGLGALRIMETQKVVFKLAGELGIQFVAAPFEDDLIRARGVSANDSDSLRTAAYPRATKGESASTTNSASARNEPKPTSNSSPKTGTSAAPQSTLLAA